MDFLLNHRFLQFGDKIHKRNRLHPSILKFTTSKKYLSLKRDHFQKHHLFNKSNPHSIKILHYHTFLYIVHAIGKINKFLTLVFKNHVLFFLKNKTFKKHHLLNKQNQQRVQILYNGTFKYSVHEIAKRKSLAPLVLKKCDS